MNVSMSSSEVLFTLCSLALSIVVLIYFTRFVINRKTHRSMKGRITPIASRTKYDDYNVFRWRGILFRYSLATAIAFALICISWTTYEVEYEYTLGPPLEEIFEVVPIVPEFPKPQPPKAAPPIIEEVIEEEIPEDQAEVLDMSVEEDDYVEPIVKEANAEKRIAPVLPPVPEEETVDVPEIFQIVEEMPRFPGCDEGMTKEERKLCSDKKLLQYLSKHLKYPSIARENNVEGRVYVQFVVEKDGSITDISVVRDIGAGCGAASQKVIDSMNYMTKKWVPGRQRGKAVRVKYTLPITFRLQN